MKDKINDYFASGRDTKYCDQRVCVFVCLFVCLSARIFQKPHELHEIFYSC